MMYNNLFASAADAILSRYRSYLQDSPVARTSSEEPAQQEAPTTTTPEIGDDTGSGAVDSQAPSTTPDTSNTPDVTTPAPTDDADAPAAEQPDDSYEPTEPTAPAEQPTYSFARKAQMSYQLRLQFDLSTMQNVVSSIANGDEQAVEQYMAAGFGLSADFDVKGHQITKSQMTGDEVVQGHRQAMNKMHGGFRRAGLMQYQDRSFGLQSFFREAMNVRRHMNTNQVDGFTRTVNQFAMRYRLDSSFSMSHLSRFNSQTEQVAAQSSNDLASYFNAAGAVAETGTNDMMATFFNAVDDYLAGAEASMLEKAEMFFDQAASELGFEGELTSMARDQIIGSVQSFFDRVETAVSSMAAQYVTPEQPDQTAVEPPTVEPKMVDPAVSDETTHLASA